MVTEKQSNEIKCIINQVFSQYEYTGISEIFCNQIALNILKSNEIKINSLNDFLSVFKKALDRVVCEYIHTLLLDETNFSVTLNKYIKREFIQGETLKNIIKVERFCKRFNITLSLDLAFNLLNSDSILMENVELLVKNNIDKITKGQVYFIFSEENVLVLIEAYCILNNIQTEEDLDDSKTIIKKLKDAGIDHYTVDTVGQYLNEMYYPVLTFEDEQNLGYIMENAKSDKEKQEARDKFILSNLKLVVKIAKNYLKTSMPFEDLIQLGNEGLIKAVDRFDYKKGFKFSTYATYWIKQNIQRSLANEGRIVRLPVNQIDKINEMKKVIQALSFKLGHTPSEYEIKKNTDFTEKDLDFLNIWYADVASLNTPLDDSDSEIEDFIEGESDVEGQFVENSLKQALLYALEHSNIFPRHQEIIKYRFRLEENNPNLEIRTLEEVGKKFRFSRERVRQIEDSVFKKIIIYSGDDLIPYLSNPNLAKELIEKVKNNPGSRLPKVTGKEKTKYRIAKNKTIYQLLPQYEKEDIDYTIKNFLNDQDRCLLFKRCIDNDLNTCSRIELTDEENRLVKLLVLRIKNILVKITMKSDNHPNVIEIDLKIKRGIIKKLSNEFNLILDIMSIEEAIIISLALGYTNDKKVYDDKLISQILNIDINSTTDIITKRISDARKYVKFVKQFGTSEQTEKKHIMLPIGSII